MATYILSAELGSDIFFKRFFCDNDTEATFEAINHIMDSAYKDKNGAWALGAIKLIDPNGSIIQSMEAK